MADTKKPYGDVEYADPGYQSDKQHRYPVDTEAHARAAWSYINKASNASAYSSADLAKVKDKIRAACKKFGIDIADSEDKAEGAEGTGTDAEDKMEGMESKNAIECRARIDIPVTTSNEILFLPTGLHAIRPVRGGIGRPIKVKVDVQTANTIEQQRAVILAKGKRPYLDFNHEDGPASFWPERFSWKSGEGVVAHGEWTASGKKAVDGKDFRAFSPVFHVDNKQGNPAIVVCSESASPNMGGLVNDPAFNSLPLWAKNNGNDADPAGGASSDQKTKEKKKMEDEQNEIASLRAKNTELAAELEKHKAVVAKDDEDQSAKDKLERVEATFRANAFELEAAELRAENKKQREDILKRNRIVAKDAVKRAVMCGAILPKDFRAQETWENNATADPTFIKSVIEPAIAARTGNRGPQDRVFPGRSDVSINAEDPTAVFAKMSSILRQSAATGNRGTKMQLGLEFSALYASEFADTEKNRNQRNRLINMKLEAANDAILAADVTDSNLGTIAGTLVTQRTLELLKIIFPELTRFTTDFSDQPATFNQTIMTRTISLPPVITYSTATGWADATAATTDVPVVINNHKGIPITFNENLLASTMRRLFGEFAEAAAYQLGKALVDSVYANLTDANFTNNTLGASSAFNRSAVIDIGTALTTRGVPLAPGSRTMLLWPAAFGNLEKDTALINMATWQRPELFMQGVGPDAALMIPIEGFQIYTSPNMPSNNANLIGFAGSRSALVIVTRTPNDYTTVLPGASFGNVQMVTDPDIGMTVMQVQYVNHTLGTATSRIALMWGSAAGQTAAGQLLKAAAGSGSSR
jgi:hypothetical protein